MAGKRGTRAVVAARWGERLDRWRRSGCSVTEFCNRERISQQSFFRWRRILSAAAPTAGATRGRGAAFVPVEVVVPSGDNESGLRTSSHAWLEIARGSLVCRVSMNVDEATLRRLVRVLCEEAGQC